MRKLVLIAMIAFVFMACQKGSDVDYTVISGTVENAKEVDRLMVRGLDFNQEIKINKDGSFLDTLKTTTGYYALVFGRDGIYVYLQTGDNLNIVTDANSFSKSIKYVSGKTKGVNEYLQKKNEEKQVLMSKIGGSKIFTFTEERFLHTMDSIKNIDLDLLKATQGLPSEFVNTESKKINYEYLQNVIMYPRYYGYFNKGAKFEPSETFNKILATVDYSNNEDYEKINLYKQMVLGHFFEKFMEDGADKKAVVEEIKVSKIKNLKNDFAKDLVSDIEPGVKNIDEIVGYIESLTTDKELLKEVKDKVAELQKLSKGEPSPSFSYESIKGKKVSLEDLKGKLVYIDVWATWCGPCKREIPFLQTIEKEYHGKDITFVSISVDTDKEAWKKMVEDKNMGGVQLYAENAWNAEFAKAYKITGIPRFILLDKEGKIISANAPRPSSGKELKDLIDTNL